MDGAWAGALKFWDGERPGWGRRQVGMDVARSFSPGFRISGRDVGVLVAGAAGSVGLGMVDGWAGVAVAFVVGHFFLFCNVVRMGRGLESVWAGVFVGMAAGVMGVGWGTWPMALMVSGGMTVIVVGVAVWGKGYHGVGWQRVNPGLRGRWEREGGKAA